MIFEFHKMTPFGLGGDVGEFEEEVETETRTVKFSVRKEQYAEVLLEEIERQIGKLMRGRFEPEYIIVSKDVYEVLCAYISSKRGATLPEFIMDLEIIVLPHEGQYAEVVCEAKEEFMYAEELTKARR